MPGTPPLGLAASTIVRVASGGGADESCLKFCELGLHLVGNDVSPEERSQTTPKLLLALLHPPLPPLIPRPLPLSFAEPAVGSSIGGLANAVPIPRQLLTTRRSCDGSLSASTPSASEKVGEIAARGQGGVDVPGPHNLAHSLQSVSAAAPSATARYPPLPD